MKRRQRSTRMRAGPIIFFIGFCISGTVVGIFINNHYYALEKAWHEMMLDRRGQEPRKAEP